MNLHITFSAARFCTDRSALCHSLKVAVNKLWTWSDTIAYDFTSSILFHAVMYFKATLVSIVFKMVRSTSKCLKSWGIGLRFLLDFLFRRLLDYRLSSNNYFTGKTLIHTKNVLLDLWKCAKWKVGNSTDFSRTAKSHK